MPKVFTTVWITRKEVPTRNSCSATGVPSFNSFAMIFLSKQINFLENSNGSAFFLRMMTNEISTLNVCAATVARAAPAAPIPKPATRTRSPTILITQAMDTVTNGVLESPIPRNTAPRRL